MTLRVKLTYKEPDRSATTTAGRGGPVLENARRQLSEKELADLTLVVATINAWNGLSIAARLEPGTYQPAIAAR